MIPTDTRGDQIADVLQIDKNGDGLYDSEPTSTSSGPTMIATAALICKRSSHKVARVVQRQMERQRVALDGVYRRRERWRAGWLDWEKFDFGNDNWGYTGTTDWLPDYNGNAVFLKVIVRRSRFPTRDSTGKIRLPFRFRRRRR